MRVIAPVLGEKRDQEKQRWDLVPWGAVREVVKVLTFGAKKYSAWNWVHVPEARERYFAALHRHVDAWRAGEELDPETGLPHLAHACCCVLFLLGFDYDETAKRILGKGS